MHQLVWETWSVKSNVTPDFASNLIQPLQYLFGGLCILLRAAFLGFCWIRSQSPWLPCFISLSLSAEIQCLSVLKCDVLAALGKTGRNSPCFDNESGNH